MHDQISRSALEWTRSTCNAPTLARFATLITLGVLLSCEAPQAPALCGSIPEQTLTVGESASVSACFDDSEGGTLSYEVWISDSGIAAISGSGSSVTVTAVSPGRALVTILASNSYGLKAQQSFRVMVPNRPPMVLGEIANHEVSVGDSLAMDVSGYFSEPDGQSLVYAAESDSMVTQASVGGAVLTVVAVAKGTKPVTVTATDPGGLTAAQSFLVTVPNQPPLPEASVAAQTVAVGDTAQVDVVPLFMDPDGDALTYSATSTDPSVAVAAIVDRTLKVTAVAKGLAMVTVTATDTEGLTAEQSFSVMVPNRPPLVADPIPARTVVVGDALTLDLTPFFTDPDGDALVYAAVVADDGVAAVIVTGSSMTVTAVGKGETNVTVTTTDGEGLAVTQDFAVTVPNQAPLAVGSIPAQTLAVDSAAWLGIARFFEDPDGDALVYAITSSDTMVARVELRAAVVVKVSAVAKGEATITVTATDTDGLVTTQDFTVTVPNRPPLVENRIEARSLRQEGTEVLDLTTYFADPDGDPLTFEAVSSTPRVVTVSVADGELTLTAQRSGRATVTVTATDSEAGSAELVFQVTVKRANDPPLVTSTISSRSLSQGQRYSSDLGNRFSDPDGDVLRFRATSSDETVATATISGNTLVVTGVGQGTASITVTASDPGGESATLRFTVSVDDSVQPNRPPEIIARLPARNISPGQNSPTDLNDHFDDPDNDQLSFEAYSADETIAKASVSGSELMIEGVSNGTTTVTVSAMDTKEQTAEQNFGVTVERRSEGNQRPVVSDVIAFQRLEHDGSFGADVSGFFTDPDNDELTYGASSSDATIATASVSGSDLTVTAVSRGTATITVTARDPGGLSSSFSFDVTVKAARPANRAPVVTATPPDRAYLHRKSLPVQGWRYFDDPDGDDLTYTGSSSNPAVGRIDQQSDIYFEVVAGRSDGDATITITAEDPDGLTSETSFLFTVGNNAPTVKRQAPALTSSRGQIDSLVLNWYFEDDDGGDELTLSVESSDPAKVAVSVEASGLYGWYAEVRGRAVGTATVTLTATDLGGLSVSQSFTVTVDPNRPPRVAATFPRMLQFIVGDTVTFVLSEYFTDPDGDDLTYTAQAGYYVSATVSDGTLYMSSPRSGIFPAIVTAEDPAGRTVEQRFIVTVYPRSSSQDTDYAAAFPAESGTIWTGATFSAAPPSSESRRRAGPRAAIRPRSPLAPTRRA